MATRLDIPQNKEQVVKQSLVIAKAYGLGLGGLLYYQPGVKAYQAYNKVKKESALLFNKYDWKIDKFIDQDNHITNSYLPQYTSFLNTRVFSDLDISFTSDIGKVINIQIPTVLFTVTQSKNIITTSIQGRNGTVKEYISDGDFKINIKGVITNSNGKYPQFQIERGITTVTDLLSMCKLNKSLTVNSWYLSQFCIYDMVVTDYEFPQLEGQYSSQPFEINAISDTPYVINNGLIRNLEL